MAHDAGDVLLPYYGRLGTADARRKGGRHRDLVSEADLKAEEMILRQIPPDDDVLAEETEERSTGASVSDTDALGDAILATGFPYACDTVADNNFDNISRVGLLAGGLCRFGSAALDLPRHFCHGLLL